VIVADLDLVRIAVDEPKANAPLVIDGNGVLAPTVVLERVQPIARGHAQIVEPGRQIHVLQLAGGSRRDVRGEALGCAGEEEVTRAPIRERLDPGEV
jgi:hypothetical protein